MESLNWLDQIVVVGYMVAVLGVGAYVARFNKATTDYFKGGGHIPWVLACVSMFISGFSAFMFVGAAGFTYTNGIAAILLFGSAFPAYFLGYFVFGKLWRRSRIETPMQFLSRRFSPSTTYFYTLLSVVPQLLRLGISIYTLCIFIASAFGFTDELFELGPFVLNGLELSMVITGVVLVAYTLLGGLWAVMVTDALQFVVLFLATIMILPLAFLKLGGDGGMITGFQRMIDEAPTRFFSLSLTDRPPLFWVAYYVGILLGYNVNWHIGQRYYSVSDERDTKKVALWSAVLSLVFPLMWILPVLASRVLYPDLNSMWPTLTDPSEAAFVTLALELLPHGLLGIMVAAMFAATMSSADTTFNWLAAVLTKDVYYPVAERLRKRPPTERTQLVVGRASVAMMGIISIWVALRMAAFGGAFDVHVKATSLFAAPMFVPVMLGFVITRTPWWSGMVSFGVGVTAVVTTSLLVNAAQGLPYDSFGALFLDVEVSPFGLRMSRYEIQMLTGVLVTATVFLLSALVRGRREPFKSRVESFERDLDTPAHFPEDKKDLRGLISIRITARLTILLGGLLMLITIPTLAQENWHLNLIGGLLCLVLGVVVLVITPLPSEVNLRSTPDRASDS